MELYLNYWRLCSDITSSGSLRLYLTQPAISQSQWELSQTRCESESAVLTPGQT
jgi:hypothetical protein